MKAYIQHEDFVTEVNKDFVAVVSKTNTDFYIKD